MDFVFPCEDHTFSVPFVMNTPTVRFSCPVFYTMVPLLMAAIVWSGCLHGDSCTALEDCFQGYVCQDNQCIKRDAINSADMMSTDMTIDQPDDGDMSIAPRCRRPQGELCDEDDYERDSSFAYIIKPDDWQYVGCKGFRDEEIIGIDKTLQGRLCRTDNNADAYSIEYNRCNTVDFVIVMELTVNSPCDRADYEVIWNAECGGQMVCTDTNPRPNVYQRRFVVPRVSSNIPTNLLSVQLKPKTQGVEIDYTLTVKTEQQP